jgi:hypothetical protein
VRTPGFVVIAFRYIDRNGPNKAVVRLQPTRRVGKQIDRMSVGAINNVIQDFVFNNSFGSVNLFPWMHHETI